MTEDLKARIETAKRLRAAAAASGDHEAAFAHGQTQGRLQCELYEAMTGEPDPYRALYAALDDLDRAVQ